MEKIRALVRRPDESFVDAISTNKTKVDFTRALYQHEQYVAALLKIGVDVDILEPQDKDPDGVFVEDTAVIILDTKIVVITNPAVFSRKKELFPVIDYFEMHSYDVRYIEPPAKFEGGDVLYVEGIFFVGISVRTGQAGYKQFRRICKEAKKETVFVIVPSDALHLKSIITYCGIHNGKHVFLCRKKSEVEYISLHLEIGCEFIEVPEAVGANCLALHGVIFLPSHCTGTKKLLFEHGLNIQTLDISEFAIKDGGLTCLSILF